MNNYTEIPEMTPLMKALKAVHSISGSEFLSEADLERQRSQMEMFSHLTPSYAGLLHNQLLIEEIPAVIVSRENTPVSKKIILYCHGGGFTCGGLSYAQILADKLCHYTGLPVIYFKYRLSPEFPYPAAINDTISIYNYLMLKGYGAADVLIAGDSAGGNLALQLTLELKKTGRMLPKALLLFSPWTDMTMEASSYRTLKDKDPLLTPEYVRQVRHAYTGGGKDYSDPSFSPLYGDLRGFPPCLIQVGSNEILKNDSTDLAKKLTKLECYAKLSIYKGGWHVFQQLPLPMSAKAMEDAAEFVNSVINY